MAEEKKHLGDGDKELDALLNSALQDFDADAAPPAEPRAPQVSEQSELMDSKWTEEFIRQAAAQFEQNMQSLMAQGAEGSIPAGMLGGLGSAELSDNFQRVAEAAARAMGDAPANDFSAAISETLRNLSAGAENIQSPISESDLQNMLGNLNLGEGEGAGDLMPFMQNMMQSLLSKDVLYPAMKDIVDKYPAWLEKHTELEDSERQRFCNQRDLMSRICVELEQESETEPPEAKTARFTGILELMQQLQEYGQPPSDLVGDSGVNLEGMTNSMLQGMPESDNPNCSIM